MDANRPVPFRLTHNISEFITPVGVNGPLAAAMIAAAKCLVQPNFKAQAILKAVLKDEILAWYKKVSLSKEPRKSMTHNTNKFFPDSGRLPIKRRGDNGWGSFD